MTTFIHGEDHFGISAPFEATGLAAAVEAVEDCLREDWAPGSETYWAHATVRPEDSEDSPDIVDVTVRIDPEEPACTTYHHWQEDPAVSPRGHGGGVIITENCTRELCGVRRITDTWAQDRATGEQGLTSVRYDIGDES